MLSQEPYIIPTSKRKFGVEIEFFGNKKSLVDRLNKVNVDTLYYPWINRDTLDCWKVTSEPSIGFQKGGELVSPILSIDQIEELERAMSCLRWPFVRHGNITSVHVHVDMSDLECGHLSTISNFMHLDGDILFSLVKKNRLISPYCKPYTIYDHRMFMYEMDGALRSTGDWRNIMNLKRLCVDFGAIPRHGTIEFRHHHGTNNFSDVINWIGLLLNLVDYLKENPGFNPCYSVDRICELLNLDANIFLKRSKRFGW